MHICFQAIPNITSQQVQDLSYRLSVYTNLRLNQPPNQRVPGTLAAGVERPERKGDHSPTVLHMQSWCA
jgi:hypothetical protein